MTALHNDRWGSLMVAAQRGERKAYEQLLRELDVWLRRYYARRLPCFAAEDARQDALLAIHAKRHTYTATRPLGPWVAAIARYKWIDHLRNASRVTTIPLDDKIATEVRTEPAASALVVDDLLSHLKPAQALVIRLVKLHGVSIEGASGATGQSSALVKINIHRGLKKLVALAMVDAKGAPNMPSSRHVGTSHRIQPARKPFRSSGLPQADERTNDGDHRASIAPAATAKTTAAMNERFERVRENAIEAPLY